MTGAAAEEKDYLEPYTRSARRTWYIYLFLVVGAVFFIVPWMIDPARDCVESECPAWLHWLASGMGFLFMAGAARALLMGAEWGSYIDAEAGAFVCWRNMPPLSEMPVPIDRIRVISIDRTGDSDSLWLLDAEDRKILFDSECAPKPWEKWAAAMAARFPHISVRKAG